MKKTAVAFICLTILCSQAFASPLTDFSAGRGSIDLTFQTSPVTETTPGWTIDYPKKGNVQYGLTLGLGNDFAFQYRNGTVKSDNLVPYNPGPGVTVNINGTLIDPNGSSVYEKMTVNEFNVLHKFNANLIGFVGVINVKGEFVNNTYNYSMGQTRKIMQYGLTGLLQLGPKTTAYGRVAAGKDLTCYEAGVSQALSDTVDLNIGYRDLKIKNWSNPSGVPIHSQLHGFEFGLTYKF